MGEKKRAKAVAAMDFDWAGPDDAVYSDQQRAELDRLYAAVASRLSGKRLEHSKRVAATARRMARRFGVDPFLAEAAGILHDWDKKLPKDELWEKARANGVVGEGADARIEPLLHAWTAAATLPDEFPELPDEVFRAIGRHTVGAIEMSDLDMVVYLADALEPGREYGTAVALRAMVCDTDLDELFARAVRDSLESLLERGRYVDVCTVDVWNAWCSLLASV